MPIVNLTVGNQNNPDNGPAINARGGRQGDTIVSGLHGRYYEQSLRGNLYTFGISNTALVAANAIATGLTATAQPIIGLYNPANSTNNLVILYATISTTTVAVSAVSPGGFSWVSSANNTNAITTGSTGINTLSLLAKSVSGEKAYSVSTPLTGLTNNLAFYRGSSINSINAAGPATAIHQPTNNPIELIDGSIIVPPGGVVGLMCQVATTTVSVTTGLLWEIVPV